MNKLLFNYEKYELEYNCSFYNVNQIPLEDRRHPIAGCLFIVTATAMIFLYIPCLVVFCQGRFRKQACYKLMIFLGVIDVVLTFCNGVLTGFFVFFGIVYCDIPVIIYIIGSFGQGLWCAQSVGLVFLALNRCLEMARSHLSEILFDKKLVYVWMVIAMIYCLIVSWFSTAFMFSGFHMTWQFNPHDGYFEDTEHKYRSAIHLPNNLFVIVAMIFIYTVFAVIFWKKTSGTTNRKHVKQTFVQVLILCVATVILCAGYIAIQFFKLPSEVTMVIQLIWIAYGGLPAIIYLTLNSTVRKHILSLVRCHGLLKSSINEQSHHNGIKSSQAGPRSSNVSVIHTRNRVNSLYA